MVTFCEITEETRKTESDLYLISKLQRILSLVMASAAVSNNKLPPVLGARRNLFSDSSNADKLHHVRTTLNYYKEADDGSAPLPTYVARPETYTRPSEPLEVTVTDITGRELDYTLDGNGFQIYYHESKEKDFLDDEKIKHEYYPETEQLLKDAYVNSSKSMKINTRLIPMRTSNF